ncbi:ATPase [Rhodothermaceae bacterium RA]|nr:ATPase [Rhodothermaceae bacterium RA]
MPAPASPTLPASPDPPAAEPPTAPVTPWARPWEELAAELDVRPEQGLSDEEAAARLRRYGPNRLRAHPRRSAWHILMDQFKSLIVALLATAALVAFLSGETLEGWAIVAVLLINAAIGFATELRAVRSMEALFAFDRLTARVRRGGHVKTLPAEQLVPGDVVLLEGGDLVTADLRLVEASKLQTDESALTGESIPVGKRPEPVAEDAPLAERTSMLYKGTAVTRGSGLALVVATGMATELGRISALVAEAEDEATPLEVRLQRLGRRLIWVTLGIAAAVVVSGTLTGKALLLMVETGLALAVAAIPEGLPIVATIALARGLRQMARRNALINRLASVETLGATGVICTDKTGTLTENRMTVTRLALARGEVSLEADAPPEPDPLLRAALEVAVLCNNASLPDSADGHPSGDPLEVALLEAGARFGLTHSALTAEAPEIREEAFDPDVKMMATFHRQPDGVRVAVKGAPEPVIAASTHVLTGDGPRPLDEATRRAWLARNQALAADGLRVIAVATRTVDDVRAAPYEALTLLGLIGMEDPPRRDVRPAIQQCRQAGIRVVMITGDQPVTARAVARAVGLVEEEDAPVIHGADLEPLDALDEATRRRLLDARLFARVSPAQKLDLIALHQQNGQVVAMTGDGVNDAPALKKADIGIAMGQRGTQVAREAADMVLLDDAFSTIVAAIEQGRIIFGNIRRFVFYLMSCNVSEMMVVGLASLIGTTLPILPLQILFLNLVTDVFPALALGVGRGEDDVLRRPPRPASEPILTRAHWLGILAYGVLFTVAVLGALLIAGRGLGKPPEEAITVSFLTLAFAQLWHVFNLRSAGSSLWRNEITRNPYVWGALGLCSGLLLLAAYLPGLARVLSVTPPDLADWGVILGMSLLPLVVGQMLKPLLRHPFTTPRR